MPLDGVMLRAVTQELAGSLPELRIDRVLQPEKDEIDLVLRGFGVTRRLVLCAHPQYARIHYSDIAKQNPPQPPMFCMLLRKHLQSSRVTSVCQQGLDRVVTMELEGYTELGERPPAVWS